MRWHCLFAVVALTVAACSPETTTKKLTDANRNRAQLSPEEAASTAKAEYDAAVEKLDDAIAKLKADVAAAKTDNAKAALLDQQNPVPPFVDQMIRLAERHPETPTAVEAALSAVARAKGPDKDRAMHFLLDHFSNRVELDAIASSFLSEIPSKEIEGWLRKIIAKADTDETKAKTIYRFVKYKDQMVPFRSALAKNPEIARRIPAEQLAYVNAPQTAEQKAEIEKMLETIIDEFGDVEYRSRRFADIAEAELFELRNLQIGQVAPDIEGKDLDDVSFKLSDYRGKIVMLDFWGHWCGPCRQMYPEEQGLVEELADKPFALIGVNSDRDLKFAQQVVRDENLTWRHFWNGEMGTRGPISNKWNVEAWPTVYLIDKDGVIRYKEILGEDLYRGLQNLLSEMGHEVRLASADEGS